MTKTAAQRPQVTISPRSAGRGFGVIAVVVLGIAVAIGATGGGKAPNQARSFYRANHTTIETIAVATAYVVQEMSTVQKDAASGNATAMYSDLVTLAQDAQTAKTIVDQGRSQLLNGNGNDAVAVWSAAGELSKALGDVQAVATSINAADIATLNNDMAQGTSDWDSAVRQLWSDAGASGPPTL